MLSKIVIIDNILRLKFSFGCNSVTPSLQCTCVESPLKGWERLLREISGAGWLQKVSGPRRSDHCATIVQRPMSNCPSSYLWSHVWPDFYGWHQNWWKIKKSCNSIAFLIVSSVSVLVSLIHSALSGGTPHNRSDQSMRQCFLFLRQQ